ncbi:MAG: (2Fe-2S)-binding protein [Pirellulales bacterium]|nr:(2Fe-2S)-binding protein [Pirellulales bacterium]
MSPAYQLVDQLVCRCLQLSEADLAEAVERNGCDSVDDVIRCTGAGDGCRGCHRRMQAFLRSETR